MTNSRQGSPIAAFATRRHAGPLVFVVVATGYLALAQFVVWSSDPVSAGAGLWPAAGLGVGALLLLPTRLWRWVLAAVLVAEVGGDLAHGYPLLSSLGWGAANSIEPWLAAVLFRRYGNRDGKIVPLGQLLRFVAIAVVVAPLVGATIGTAATIPGFGGDPLHVWTKFFVGDALGVLTIAPALLTIPLWRAERARRPARSRVEAAALGIGALTVSVLIFGDWSSDWTFTVAYLVVPFFTWAALRFGLAGTSWLVFLVAMTAHWLTAVGGPFSGLLGPTGDSVTMLHLFLGITVTSAFVLAVLVGDLSGRDEVERALRHLAAHDPLTGLLNRTQLANDLTAALALSRTDPTRVAMLVCDIDHLKIINDTFGHRAGDELIVRVAERLRAAIRPGDLVARIGGDEFVVVLTDVDEFAAAELSRRIVDAVATPVTLDGNKDATPSVSVGAAMGEPGASGESIFLSADAALYEAKRLGRGRTFHFDDALRTELSDRLEIERELPAALADRQIVCLHQPQIILATGELFAFESLARWNRPGRGQLGASRFIPVVEATGNAGPLFELLLEQTLDAQRGWLDVLGFRPHVAVNVSPRQLAGTDLVRTVRQALARAEAPTDCLWLELTETATADAAGLASLGALRDLGVRVALDDFGTGWSSISRLSRHSWDVVKIDRSFVAGLDHDGGAIHLVRAMIDMAHGMGIQTVGEGVETPEQLACLTELGCDIVQGFLLSAGVTAEQAATMVDDAGRWTGYAVTGDELPPCRAILPGAGHVCALGPDVHQAVDLPLSQPPLSLPGIAQLPVPAASP